MPLPTVSPLIVGMTGGIGCGKSTAARLFSELGVETIDADDLSRSLSQPDGQAYPLIVQLFGPRVRLPDGQLDRTFIRKSIFSNEALRNRLEAILHPLVAEETARRIAEWHGPYGLWIVPLLLEKPGLRARANRVLVVDCPEEQQIARVTASRGLSEDDVRAIIRTQCPRHERLALADDILDNSSAFETLPAQVARLDQLYRSLARAQLPAGDGPGI